jgi:hypothetical protein
MTMTICITAVVNAMIKVATMVNVAMMVNAHNEVMMMVNKG